MIQALGAEVAAQGQTTVQAGAKPVAQVRPRRGGTG